MSRFLLLLAFQGVCCSASALPLSPSPKPHFDWDVTKYLSVPLPTPLSPSIPSTLPPPSISNITQHRVRRFLHLCARNERLPRFRLHRKLSPLTIPPDTPSNLLQPDRAELQRHGGGRAELGGVFNGVWIGGGTDEPEGV